MRAAVRSFCRYLIRMKCLTEDITKDVAMPKVEASRRIGPSEDKIDLMLQAVETMPLVNNVGERKRHAFRACLYLMVMVGLRIKEIAELRVEDIDMENRNVFVRLGKGGKPRRVKAPDEFWPVITAYLAQRPAYPGDRLLVYSARHPMGDTSPAIVLRKIMDAAGLVGEPITPHCMRHAFAMRGEANGAPLTVIAAQLGHSKVTTTAIYLRSPMSVTEEQSMAFGRPSPFMAAEAKKAADFAAAEARKAADLAEEFAAAQAQKAEDEQEIANRIHGRAGRLQSSATTEKPKDTERAPEPKAPRVGRQETRDQRFRRYVVNRAA
jgi:site-specific recombinase XerD